MKSSKLLISSIVLISTIGFIVDRQYQEQSIVLKCSGYPTYETNGIQKEEGKPYLLEKIYNFSNKSFLGLYDDWKMIEDEHSNGREFNDGELHLPDRDILESVYVNKDHISIIYSDILRVSKGKDYFSENYETVRVDRNTGEWKYTYIYKVTDKNNKLTNDYGSHIIGSCERFNKKL